LGDEEKEEAIIADVVGRLGQAGFAGGYKGPVPG